jgi:hypothetical protein
MINPATIVANTPEKWSCSAGEMVLLYWQIGRDILDRQERPNYRNGFQWVSRGHLPLGSLKGAF